MSNPILNSRDTLLDLFESMFQTEHGPPMAFFHIPVNNAEPIRAIYTSYVAKGENLQDVTEWFAENVVRPLARKAGEGAFLYWRLPEKLEVCRIESDDMWTVRTRIVVLDKALNLITVDTLKEEGAQVRNIDKEPQRVTDYE